MYIERKKERKRERNIQNHTYICIYKVMPEKKKKIKKKKRTRH